MRFNSKVASFPWRRWHLISALVVMPVFLLGHFVFLTKLSQGISVDGFSGMGWLPLNVIMAPVFYGPALFFMFSSLVLFYEGQNNIFTFVTLENSVYTLFRASSVGIVLLILTTFFLQKNLLLLPTLMTFNAHDVADFVNLSVTFVIHVLLVMLAAFVLGVSLWKSVLRFGLLQKHHSQRLALYIGLLLALGLIGMELGLLIKGGIL